MKRRLKKSASRLGRKIALWISTAWGSRASSTMMISAWATGGESFRGSAAGAGVAPRRSAGGLERAGGGNAPARAARAWEKRSACLRFAVLDRIRDGDDDLLGGQSHGAPVFPHDDRLPQRLVAGERGLDRAA